MRNQRRLFVILSGWMIAGGVTPLFAGEILVSERDVLVDKALDAASLVAKAVPATAGEEILGSANFPQEGHELDPLLDVNGPSPGGPPSGGPTPGEPPPGGLLPHFPGDANGDGMVDLTDLNIVRNSFGDSGLGDLDASGVVDIDDLDEVRTNFGNRL